VVQTGAIPYAPSWFGKNWSGMSAGIMGESENLRDAPNSTHRKQRLPEPLCIET
jgi:hypothetical protein